MSEKLRKIEEYFICFMLYSVIGWFCETILFAMTYGKKYVNLLGGYFFNRGYLYGPYVLFSGFIAIVFVLIFERFLDKKKFLLILPIYVECAFLSFLVQIIYMRWNARLIEIWARCCFPPCIYPNVHLWYFPLFYPAGISGLIILYILQPLFEKMLSKLSTKIIRAISVILFVIVTIDIIFSLVIH